MKQLNFKSKMRGKAGTPVVLDRELLTRLEMQMSRWRSDSKQSKCCCEQDYVRGLRTGYKRKRPKHLEETKKYNSASLYNP